MSAKKSKLRVCPFCDEEVELDKHIVHVFDLVRTKGSDEPWHTRSELHPCVYLYEYENDFHRTNDTKSNK